MIPINLERIWSNGNASPYKEFYLKETVVPHQPPNEINFIYYKKLITLYLYFL
jgi:hypothetical protein